MARGNEACEANRNTLSRIGRDIRKRNSAPAGAAAPLPPAKRVNHYKSLLYYRFCQFCQ